MAGISSKAFKPNYTENRRKYNSIEYTADFDLDMYDAFYRNLDPQIGRWWQIDPEIEKMVMCSTYVSNYNNPVLLSDPLGNDPDDDDPVPQRRSIWQGIKKGVTNFLTNAATPPAVTLYRIGKAAFNGDIKPAVTLLAPGIGKADDAVEFVEGDAQTKARILTETTLDVGAAFAGDKILNFKISGAKAEVKAPEVKIDKPYQRPTDATTKEQRASVQNKSCVKCGVQAKTMVAGHKKALVKEYYETGTIDKKRMQSIEAVQSECPTSSAKEGAEMSKYSKEQKKKRGL